MILEEPTDLFPSITMKDRMFRAISLCLLGALLLGAADAPQKSAFDKPTMEAYVRHLYVLQPQLTVTISDPKPSALPGFKEVRVRIAQGAQSQEVPLYVSNDGKKIVQGAFYDIANNPFKPELDKLKRSEEHTSELQSLRHLVCRLQLEKKINNEEHTSELQSLRHLVCRLLLETKI